jgi:hypothetical protein
MKIEITNIESAIINTFTYNYDTKEMIISFGEKGLFNAKYLYKDVDSKVVNEFLDSESKGKYINSIKTDYEYEKYEEASGTMGQPSNLI